MVPLRDVLHSCLDLCRRRLRRRASHLAPPPLLEVPEVAKAGQFASHLQDLVVSEVPAFQYQGP